MGAQIRSAEHAREFVSWAKFAPQGVRGLNSSGCDAGYTHKPLAQFVGDAPQPLDETLTEALGTTTQALIQRTHWPNIDLLGAQLNLYWSEFQIPVYLTAGNHDIGGWVATPPPAGTARRDW